MNLRLAPDALHPNAEGNRLWAEFLAPFVAGKVDIDVDSRVASAGDAHR